MSENIKIALALIALVIVGPWIGYFFIRYLWWALDRMSDIWNMIP